MNPEDFTAQVTPEYATRPLVTSRADEPESILRERFDEYGYLHLRQALSPDSCEHLLQALLGALAGHVTYDAQRRHPILTGEPFYETDPVWDQVYPAMQSLYAFHRFFHEEDALRLMRLVVGEEVFVYPMKMARVATPRTVGFETPPHQDAHSHQGGPTMAGIWVALHDVTEGMGRLKLLPGSHRHGVRRVLPAAGVGGVQCELFTGEEAWHVSDLEQGDVILFHACCVHAAEPNTSDSNVRVSVDTRFCDHGAPVFVTNLEPHHGWRIDGLDWESIYRDWGDKSLQYYWRDYPNLTRELQHPIGNAGDSPLDSELNPA